MTSWVIPRCEGAIRGRFTWLEEEEEERFEKGFDGTGPSSLVSADAIRARWSAFNRAA